MKERIIELPSDDNRKMLYADHKDTEPGEIMIGWFSENHIIYNVTWLSKRKGDKCIKNKYPLFVSELEVRNHELKFLPSKVHRLYFNI